MSEYIEKRIVQDAPVGNPSRVKTRIDSVVNGRRGMSGVAIAALVLAAATAAVVITMLIINNQQQTRDDQLAQERARTAAAQQPAAQPAQQPLIVTVPASQPTVAVPFPVASPAQPLPSYAAIAPSNAGIEIDVTSLLQNDAELGTSAVSVKVTDGTAVLSGYVSDEALKKRAEKLAGTVHGVKRVINDIAVRP